MTGVLYAEQAGIVVPSGIRWHHVETFSTDDYETLDFMGQAAATTPPPAFESWEPPLRYNRKGVTIDWLATVFRFDVEGV